MSTRRVVLLFGALVAVRIATVPIFLAGQTTRGTKTVLPGDVRRYQRIATSHGRPYREFEVEYPPLTLAAIDALASTSVRTATERVMWTQLGLDLAIAALVAWGWGRRASLWYLAIGAPFVLYPFLYLRLDLLSVFLAVLGVVLVRRALPVTGGVALAAACFTKVWPVALFPMLAVRRAWRSVWAIGSVGVVGVAAWVAWGSPAGPGQVLTYRGARGWQIESVPGAVAHVLGPARARVEAGAWRTGAPPRFVFSLLTLAALGAVAAIWWAAWRSGDRRTRMLDGLAPLAAISALLVFAPILSPQYMAWIVPAAAIAAAGGEADLGVLTAVLVALSTLDLFWVKELSYGFWYAQAVVLVRNLLLVVLLVVAGRRVRGGGARAAEASESEDHGAPTPARLGS